MNIADKYAVAFLNVYGDRLTFDDSIKTNEAAQFLHQHPRALFLLKVPVIKQTVKEEGLRNFCRRFALPQVIDHIIDLLLEHKRAYLLADVFKAMVKQYQERHHISNIVIKSSTELPQPYRDEIVQFVDRQISGTKQYRYEVDPTLIAGIRIQSDTMLWEISIDKRLRELASKYVGG
jgi:F-type H+-transporting ATPase subunit delta